MVACARWAPVLGDKDDTSDSGRSNINNKYGKGKKGTNDDGYTTITTTMNDAKAVTSRLRCS
jgi:hypothetical protein